MSLQLKYIKYKTKYKNLWIKMYGSSSILKQTPDLYIDVYKFKLLNYPSNLNERNITFGKLSKTSDINKGIIQHVIDEKSYYSIDYIKSDNISNKYYKQYLDHPAKSTQKYKYTDENIQDLLSIISKTILKLQNKLQQILPHLEKLGDFEGITNETGYITKINITNKNKIIIFGDHHGSYHTFFRNMLRLHLCGVINLHEYKVNDNYIIIFLGDIVDRGNYSLEILEFMFNFIIKNESNKFIINRGNHEEKETTKRYGFFDEIKYKIQTKTETNTIFDNIIKIFTLCPTAIILINTDTKKKYWLCHGLICNDSNIDSFINNNQEIIFILDVQQATNIRWTDTPSCNPENNTLLDEDPINTPDGRHRIGTKTLSKYLSPEYFDFIIRGHEDRYSNAWLLSSTMHRMHMGINYENTFNNKFTIYKNIISQLLYENDKQITTNNYCQLDGPVQTITNLPHKYIYNVLTISTNTDLKRPLTSDSYIVMRFDDNILPNVNANNILPNVNANNNQEINTWLNSSEV